MLWSSYILENHLGYACSIISGMSDSLQPFGRSPPGSSVHGILQARGLEWAAMPSSRGFSRHRDETHISCTVDGFFTTEPPGKPMGNRKYLNLARAEAQERERDHDKQGRLKWHLACVCVKSLQSCLTLCDPMDCSPPGSSIHGDSLSKNTGAGCHFFFQGIFPTQGSNLHLLRLLHW